ncbi:uncharacterized protein LOC126101302 [Schistocerca cancellata]|uniref:uncharacterized protein LOC126101302 n=1 Tax=Schistocerca cancellata TaxID=274614 RepID=UPI0021199174|nr:uncharacterized protein LOC126101302 [Schistocerca cancellata]
MLVAGNTAHGVYRRKPDIEIFIDVSDVVELKEFTIDSEITIGGNMTLTEVMELFYDVSKSDKNFSYTKMLADHIDLVANVSVRNAGTVAGNLSIKHMYQEFPSDIFLILEAADARINIAYNGNKKVSSVSVVDYLKIDMNHKIIKNITLPSYDDSYYFKTYKIMPRAQNSHAYVNAGFLFKLDVNDVGKVICKPRIVFGGIHCDLIHATELEQYLKGENIYESSTIQQALRILDSEIQPEKMPPEASPEYRKGLAVALFYKFVLSISPESLKPNLRSGGEMLKRPLSSGKQVYDTKKQLWPLGKPVSKLEALFQCSGEAIYVNDMPTMPGELYCAFVVTSIANGHIRGTDPSDALAVPGVVAYYDAKDIPGKNNFYPKTLTSFTDEEIFCSGNVKYNGQPVGVIVAESHVIADEAAKLVKINYDVVNEPIIHLRDALKSGDKRRVMVIGEIKPTDTGSSGHPCQPIVTHTYWFLIIVQSCTASGHTPPSSSFSILLLTGYGVAFDYCTSEFLGSFYFHNLSLSISAANTMGAVICSDSHRPKAILTGVRVLFNVTKSACDSLLHICVVVKATYNNIENIFKPYHNSTKLRVSVISSDILLKNMNICINIYKKQRCLNSFLTPLLSSILQNFLTSLIICHFLASHKEASFLDIFDIAAPDSNLLFCDAIKLIFKIVQEISVVGIGAVCVNNSQCLKNIQKSEQLSSSLEKLVKLLKNKIIFLKWKFLHNRKNIYLLLEVFLSLAFETCFYEHTSAVQWWLMVVVCVACVCVEGFYEPAQPSTSQGESVVSWKKRGRPSKLLPVSSEEGKRRKKNQISESSHEELHDDELLKNLSGCDDSEEEDMKFSPKKGVEYYAGHVVTYDKITFLRKWHSMVESDEVSLCDMLFPMCHVLRKMIFVGFQLILRNDYKIFEVTPLYERKNAKHVIKGSFDIGKQYHYTMETQCAVCIPTEDGMDVYAATQWMDATQTAISQALKMPENRINVQVKRLGGAYGAKVSRNMLVSTACALAAHLQNRPVRFILPLERNMESIGKRHDCAMDYEVGVEDDGTIMYLEANTYHNIGDSLNDHPVLFTLANLPNCYDTSTWKVTASVVFTDIPSNTWCRAPGTTEGIAFTENIMEHIAKVLGKDAIEVKLKNLPKNDTNIADMVPYWKNKSDYPNRVLAIQDFNKKNRWRKRGISIVPMKYRFDYLGNFHAIVSVYASDGTVSVSHGGIECGQGINTKVAQVCAHALGVPLQFVSVKPSNVLTSPNNMVTGGSIASESCVYATLRACEELSRRLAPVREKLKDPSWQELIAAAFLANVNLCSSFMMYVSDKFVLYYIYGVTVAEVEVDILTGQHQILRVDILEDAGESLSPEIDVGQVEGAFVMGLGYWLKEFMVYDDNTGKALTNRTWNYKPPGAKDIPIDFRIELRKNAPNPVGVLRSKATGEPPFCMSISALFAIREAVLAARQDSGYSAKWFEMNPPATPEKVFLTSLTNYNQFEL